MHISQKKWSELIQQWKDQAIHYCLVRPQLTISVGVLTLLATATVAGHSYVKANTYDAYFVYVGNERVGAVTKPEVIEKHIINKYNQLQVTYPNAHMVFNTSQLRYEYKKLFRTPANNQLAIKQVDNRLETNALGVEIKVNGKSLGIIKDRFAAERVLELIKAKYIPAQAQQKEQVTIASLSSDVEPVEQNAPRVLEEVRFLEDIAFENVEVSPASVLSEEQIMAKLKTGGQGAQKYTVQEGDTLSTSAAKFGVSQDLIRQNNKWIVDDTIFPDDVLDVTNWRPALSVKTVEVEKENQSINYAITYQEDASLKKGRTVVVKAGVPGKKIATYRLTKINGVLDEEELIDEQIISQPVTAIIKRGTKIIKGEGTGNFLRPVYGGRMTSSYGMRWGRLHKGVDLVSSNRTIRAADAGRVEFAGYKSDYGYHIIINHGNGYKTLYGHLRSMSVHSGDIVESGESIGVMGNTGHSTGTHLHFEVIKNGIVRNPAAYLNR
jgi:murein DD-endopeptidase MepM/ murein hydrolase activator NlpD